MANRRFEWSWRGTTSSYRHHRRPRAHKRVVVTPSAAANHGLWSRGGRTLPTINPPFINGNGPTLLLSFALWSSSSFIFPRRPKTPSYSKQCDRLRVTMNSLPASSRLGRAMIRPTNPSSGRCLFSVSSVPAVPPSMQHTKQFQSPYTRRRRQSITRLQSMAATTTTSFEDDRSSGRGGSPSPIYVAATRQHVGKTSTSLALLSGLQKRFPKVGFMKPVGQQSTLPCTVESIMWITTENQL